MNITSIMEKIKGRLTKPSSDSERQQEELRAYIDRINDDLVLDKIKYEKFNELLHFKPIADDNISNLQKRAKVVAENLKNLTRRYDKIVLDNLEVLSLIGHHCPLKNLKEYIEVILSI